MWCANAGRNALQASRPVSIRSLQIAWRTIDRTAHHERQAKLGSQQNANKGKQTP
jgi:hypothetical protein